MQNYSTKQKMREFFSRYGYLIAIRSGLALLTLVIILSATLKPSNKPQGGKQEQVNSQITFCLPMLDASIYKDYNGSELVYNETLKQFEAHKAIDFLASSNMNVYAVLDGVVADVYSNYLEGNVVVIQHANGLKTSYGSLGDNVKVKIGDSVSKGDIIGVASESAYRECGIGSYLHFATLDENGKKIDPNAYLTLSSK